MSINNNVTHMEAMNKPSGRLIGPLSRKFQGSKAHLLLAKI